MTQISDDLYIGDAPTSTVINNAARGFGPVGRHVTYDIVPLSANTTAMCGALATPAVGSLTITPTAGVTTTTAADGTTLYALDVPRNVVAVSTSGSDTTPTLTVAGKDIYKQDMSATITLTGTTSVGTLKAFSGISSLTLATTNCLGNLSVGTGNVFGLPFILPDVNDVVAVKWASALAQDTGTAVKADATSPATTATGDVRGTYAPSSASNGSRRLTITQYLPDTAVAPAAPRSSTLGVDQK